MSVTAAAVYFQTAAEFRRWLAKHHTTRAEVWVGYFKKDTGQPSMTWPESVDEALCYGWIDGIRRRVDERRYMIRFTPRAPRSRWSAVNIGRAKLLVKTGRMRPAGQRAFERATTTRARGYSYERRNARLTPAQAARFRASARAWTFFQQQPPSYRRAAVLWVVTAVRPETRERRFGTLVRDSAQRRRVGPLRRPS